MMIKDNAYNSLYKEFAENYGKNKNEIFKKRYKEALKAIEGTNFKSEEKEQAYRTKIYQKIEMGEKLTPQEMSYIQRTDPTMYMRIKRIQMQKEALERRLKQCRSKQEVDQVYSEAISMIHKKDPDRQLLIKAYDNTIRGYKKTGKYKALPLIEKDKKKRKNKNRTDIPIREWKSFDETI